MSLDKAAILSAPDTKVTPVEVPEWGGQVCIRVLTLAERGEMEARNDNASGADVLGNLVAYSLCDASGARLFVTDEEIAAVKAKNAFVMLRLATQCRKLNALSAQDVETIAKNSGAALNGDSSSGSASASA